MANIHKITGILTPIYVNEYIINMYSLNVERGKYLVVSKGVSTTELMDIYKMPIDGEAYEGRIIKVLPISGYCLAKVGDSYESIAKRNGCSLEKLIKLNKNAIVYPTKRIWLP